MARISQSRGRTDENSGYTRLFGNAQLGQLMSKVQAAVIRTGNQLEEIIQRETPLELQSTLSQILAAQEGLFAGEMTRTQVVFKPKMPGTPSERGGQADIAIFDHQNRKLLVIELKDGDTFDTKKASGELYSMKQFADWIADKTGYEATYFFCSFNQDSKEAIVKGAKGRFDIDHAMTGRELCAILTIDYDRVRRDRRNEQPENLSYFLEELVRIPEIRGMIRELLQREDNRTGESER